MLDLSKKIAIFGIGGFAKDLFYCIKDIFKENDSVLSKKIIFIDKETTKIEKFLGCSVMKESEFDSSSFQIIIAIGDPKIRKQIVDNLPENSCFPNVIHPTAIINETVKLGKGNIIMQNVIISCDVNIGNFCVLDRIVNLGHDSIIEDFVHCSPGVIISGNVIVNSLVAIGSGALLKQNIQVVESTIIGMGCVVVKDLLEKGVYVENPAKKIK